MDRSRWWVMLPALFAASSSAAAAQSGTAPSAAAIKDPIARARALYNESRFDAAIAAADQGRAVAARADSADLIAARAYLERFRKSGVADDLTNARDRLRRLDPQRFGARERVEFLVGISQTVFFDASFRSAAECVTAVSAPA